jgi:hypothetical protein
MDRESQREKAEAELRLLGYVLGDVPPDPGNGFYAGLWRLVQTHLGLR